MQTPNLLQHKNPPQNQLSTLKYINLQQFNKKFTMLKLVHTSTKEIQSDYKLTNKKIHRKKTIAKNLDGDISNVHSKLYPDMTLTSQTIKSI